MLAIKPQFSLKDARQYFKEHLSVGDYYTQGQHVPGHWFGQGAEDLRLTGVTHWNMHGAGRSRLPTFKPSQTGAIIYALTINPAR